MKTLNIDAFADEIALELIPDAVIELVEVIGSNAAIALVQALGGIDLQVPNKHSNNRNKQKLIEVLGVEPATKLIEAYGGDRLYIPRCRLACIQLRNYEFVQKISQAMASGKTQTEAIQTYAPLYGFSERWAYKILSEARTTTVQKQLF